MIPRVFHFVFGLKEQTEPFHLMYYLCLASCLDVNQPDQVVFHCHHEPWGPWWDRIRPRLTLQRIEPDRMISAYRYADASLAPFRYAHLTDVARLQILLEQGGIYADMDTLFVQPLPDDLLRHPCVMGHETPPPDSGANGSLCNAWIAAEPGSAFCDRWLRELPQAFDGSWANHATRLPYLLSCEMPQAIHVEPESSFFALDWTPQAIADLFEHDVPLPDNAYSLHLWNHLWWNPQRLDFSHFHHGRLTPDYVRHARTTYARLARRFLPDDVPTSALSLAWQRISSTVGVTAFRIQRQLRAAT